MRPIERLFSIMWGALAGQTEGEKMLSYISPFQDYPNNTRTFI